MKYFQRTVSRDLILWLTLAVVAAAAVLAGGYYYQSTIRSEMRLTAHATETMDNLSNVLTGRAWNLDKRGIRRVARAYLGSSHVAGLRVQLQYDDRTETVFESWPRNAGQMMGRKRAITRNDNVLGSVEVLFGRPAFGQMRATALFVMAGITLAAVIVIILGTSVVMHFVLRSPLKDLTRGIQKIAEGDYETSLEPVPQQDINEIVGHVNRMREQIASRTSRLQEEIKKREETEEELKKHRDHLEDLVEERTAQLRETNAELKRSNKELEQFAYAASHDLKEPLRKVTGFGERMEKHCGDRLGEKGKDYLERMTNAAGRMSDLIDDLLTLSRVSTKGEPFQRVDLEDIIANVLSDMQICIQETDAEIEVGDLPDLEADPTQMRQLFQNLIGNAIKFRKEDVPPAVRIEGEIVQEGDNEECCRITVEDNGIGFDEQYLDKVFTIFQRLHARSEYRGSGMGLALCDRIVKRHGGSITAESERGKGATFIVTLPREHAEMDDEADLQGE